MHLSFLTTRDQDDHVLDILVQSRRNKKAAKKFFRKLLKGLTYVPRVVVTDTLKSYGAAKREMLPGVEHRQCRYLNHRFDDALTSSLTAHTFSTSWPYSTTASTQKATSTARAPLVNFSVLS
jgi:transposase-like protein